MNGCYLTKRFFLLLLRLTLAWKISAAVLPIPASECVSAVFSCVQMTVLPDIGIFNMHVDVGVCDCTQGLYGHHKSALKVDSRIYNSSVSYWKLYLCFMGLSLYGYASVCFVQVLSLCKAFFSLCFLHCTMLNGILLL